MALARGGITGHITPAEVPATHSCDYCSHGKQPWRSR
jgi:hypothetical protein